LEQTTLRLAEMKDRTSRFESDVTSLRAAMAGGGVKVEEVRQEVASLKAQPSDWPMVKKAMTNLEQELAKLREEMRATRPKQNRLRRRRHMSPFLPHFPPPNPHR
jgi:predicted  nucleic acid-binding Zn-ribbon protein